MAETEKFVGRALGVDPGSKRIGLAISDELGLLARPLEVWKKKSRAEDVGRIVALVREHEIKRVVVGVPYRLDGSKGPAAERAQAFLSEIRAALLDACLAVEVVERDEALTTWEAEESLKARGLDLEARKALIDAYAAAVILQEDLDQRTSRPAPDEV